MRACASCMYYQGDKEQGQCYNRPPYIHVHVYPADPETGRTEFQHISLRPAVRSDDYCAFFHHFKKPDNAIKP